MERPIPLNVTQSTPSFIFVRTIVVDLVTVIIIGTLFCHHHVTVLALSCTLSFILF